VKTIGNPLDGVAEMVAVLELVPVFAAAAQEMVALPIPDAVAT
jgi:hypothetical protein